MQPAVTLAGRLNLIGLLQRNSGHHGGGGRLDLRTLAVQCPDVVVEGLSGGSGGVDEARGAGLGPGQESALRECPLGMASQVMVTPSGPR